MVIVGSTVTIIISIFMLGFRFTANTTAWPDPWANVLTFGAVIVMLGGIVGVWSGLRHNPF